MKNTTHNITKVSKKEIDKSIKDGDGAVYFVDFKNGQCSRLENVSIRDVEPPVKCNLVGIKSPDDIDPTRVLSFGYISEESSSESSSGSSSNSSQDESFHVEPIRKPAKVISVSQPKIIRDVTWDEKEKLIESLDRLPQDQMDFVIQIITDDNLYLTNEEVIDIGRLSTQTLRKIQTFVDDYEKSQLMNAKRNSSRKVIDLTGTPPRKTKRLRTDEECEILDKDGNLADFVVSDENELGYEVEVDDKDVHVTPKTKEVKVFYKDDGTIDYLEINKKGDNWRFGRRFFSDPSAWLGKEVFAIYVYNRYNDVFYHWVERKIKRDSYCKDPRRNGLQKRKRVVRE